MSSSQTEEAVVPPHIPAKEELIEKTIKKINRFSKQRSYLIYVLKHYRNHSHISFPKEKKESEELQKMIIILTEYGLLKRRIVSSADERFDRKYHISITGLGIEVLNRIE